MDHSDGSGKKGLEMDCSDGSGMKGDGQTSDDSPVKYGEMG